MKIYKNGLKWCLSVFPLLVCLHGIEAHAQGKPPKPKPTPTPTPTTSPSPTYSPAPVTEKTPSPYKQEINQCTKTVSAINNKYRIMNSIFELCENNKGLRDKINATPDEWPLCVERIFRNTNYSNNLMVICLYDDIRENLGKTEFLECLSELKPYDLNSQQFEYCAVKENREYIKSSEYKTCYAIHREANYASPNFSFQYCKDKGKAAALNSEEFKNCQKEVTAIGLPEKEILRHCADENNQRPENIAKLASCANKVKQVTGVSGVELCTSSWDRDLLTDKNLTCLSDLNKKYLDKTYFSDENEWDRKKLLKSFLQGCGHAPRPQPLNSPLQFVGVKFVSGRKQVTNTEVGGLSGLAYDAGTGTFKIVSDDPGFRNSSRLYNVKADFKNPLSLDFISHTDIKTPIAPAPVAPGAPVDKKSLISSNIDAEGIALLPDNLMAISSETQLPGSDDYIRLYKRDGSLVTDINLPLKFLPKTERSEEEEEYRDCKWISKPKSKNGGYNECEDKKRTIVRVKKTLGVELNKAFEALTSVPDKNILFTANESPLTQDVLKEDRLVRIIRISKEDAAFSKTEEFLYPLENKDGNGLVELVALDENRLFVLERRFSENSRRITAQIFEVDLHGAKDYSDVESLTEKAKEGRLDVLKKRLLLNLADTLDFMPEDLRTLDNLEGMALGPKLPNGKQALVLVSDNNFSSFQVTQFIVLEFTP